MKSEEVSSRKFLFLAPAGKKTCYDLAFAEEESFPRKKSIY